MKIRDGYVIRKIGIDYYAIALSEIGKEERGMMRLNNVGAFLWNLMTCEISIDALVSALCAEYDVSPEVAKRDVCAFVDKLAEAGIVD